MGENPRQSDSRAPTAWFFDGGSFEPQTGRLVVAGVERRIRPKTAEVLESLLERPGELVSKAELVDRIWRGTAGDEALAVCVAELRRALGDDPRESRLIGTLHRRGYRFLGSVAAVPLELDAGTAPPLGRGVALDVLDGWWSAARAGTRTTGFVAGEAGSGKSAVIDAFVRAARGRGVIAVGAGRCVDRDVGEPYLPVLDAFAEISRGPNGARFRELVGAFAPTWSGRSGAGGRLAGEASDLLDAFARVVPTILVLEDLHAGDRPTIALLAHLAQRPAGAKLLLLCTYRPEEVGFDEADAGGLGATLRGLRGLRRCEHHDLAPLDDAAVGDLLRRRLTPRVPSPALVRQVLAHTEGNALFVSELVEALDDAHLVADADGFAETQAPITGLGIPERVRGLVAERIARLADDDRMLLAVAATVGVEFGAAEVAAGLTALRPEPAGDVALRAIEARLLAMGAGGHVGGGAGLLAELEPAAGADGSVDARFRFRHEFVRDALIGDLGGLGEAHRALVHRAIGGWLADAPARDAADPAAIAEHFDIGRDEARAALHYAGAAEAALRRSAPAEALALARRGAALADRPGVEVAGTVRLSLQLSVVSAGLALPVPGPVPEPGPVPAATVLAEGLATPSGVPLPGE